MDSPKKTKVKRNHRQIEKKKEKNNEIVCGNCYTHTETERKNIN